MPFIALKRGTTERIDITRVDNPRSVLKSGDCVCQLCGAPLMVRAGTIYRPHFAHWGDAVCATEYRHHPESADHREAKIKLVEFLVATYQEYTTAKLEYEVPIPEVRRVADVMAEFPMGWRIAHEIQLAGISILELQERTDEYYRAGIDVVWWLGKTANSLSNRRWCIDQFGFCVSLDIRCHVVS